VATSQADAVVVVGSATVKGVRAIARTTKRLRLLGVEATRIIVAINRAPRSPRIRSEVSRAIAALCDEPALRNPLFILDRKRIELCHRDAIALPDAFCSPIARVVTHAIEQLPPRHRDAAKPAAVVPGSLGTGRQGGPIEGLSA
jgi:hypothetical protein